MTCFRMDNGQSVYRFCQENNYNYFSFFYAIEQGATFEEALENAKNAKEVGKSHPKYYYNGQAVVKIFGYGSNEYDRIRHGIRRGLSVEEAVEKELNRIGRPQKANEPKYFYKGKALVDVLGRGTGKYQKALKMIHSGLSVENAVGGLL